MGKPLTKSQMVKFQQRYQIRHRTLRQERWLWSIELYDC
jgi:hypothetical protein